MLTGERTDHSTSPRIAFHGLSEDPVGSPQHSEGSGTDQDDPFQGELDVVPFQMPTGLADGLEDESPLGLL